jgi:hypothetical protein
MPEIWLKYGNTDIALDIKFENLLKNISSDFPSLTDDEIRSELSNVLLDDNMLIFALSDSKYVARVITILLEMARAKGFVNVTIDVLPKVETTLKTNFADKTISMNRIGYQSFHNRIEKFQNIIFISQISYDPLFGFGGTPTILLRNYVYEQMLESFQARQGDLPQPGVSGPPLKIALSNSEKISAKSIEIIANSLGIAGIYYGNIIEAFQNAVTKLQSISVIEVELAKSAIISASSEIGPHLTLADSLNSLWNSVHIVRENGSAVLIAENRNGIGGGALQMLIEGRLNIEELKQKAVYIDGLEHILYIEELRQKCEFGIVSTLPQYYLKTKLGFRVYESMKDVLEKLLVKHGKNHKVLVLSDADIIFLKAI